MHRLVLLPQRPAQTLLMLQHTLARPPLQRPGLGQRRRQAPLDVLSSEPTLMTPLLPMMTPPLRADRNQLSSGAIHALLARLAVCNAALAEADPRQSSSSSGGAGSNGACGESDCRIPFDASPLAFAQNAVCTRAALQINRRAPRHILRQYHQPVHAAFADAVNFWLGNILRARTALGEL